MKRFKKYSFWVSLSGAIILFVQVLGRIFNFISNDELINDLVMSFAGILVVLGVVSSPTDENDDNTNEKEH
ncbi:MAG: hypothetical protein J5779_03055 [Clostridia bacterium]|nr:hypothetical protein [Clostridia bacterium]